jgi:hypothetical protein
MIELFAYKNQMGKKSIKIVAVTGQLFEGSKRIRFGGISLGKVLFNSSHSIDDVLYQLRSFEPLDHMPKRGEGLPEFNDCWKMFNTSNVYCWLGQLDPKKIVGDDLEKTIKFLKGLSDDEQDKLADTVSKTDYTDPEAMAIIPAQILGILSRSSSSASVSRTAYSAMSVAYKKGIDPDRGFLGIVVGGTSGSSSGSSSADFEDDSEVIRNLRALANSLGYDIVKL